MTDPRIVIRHGSPSDEEVAAMTVAVLGLASGGPAPQPRRAPAWARASRLEAVGLAPFTASNDARLQHRPSGALPPTAG